MPKAPVVSRATRQALAAKRRRAANGQFAYEGGRKKPPKKGRRRVTADQLSGAKDALLALRSKKGKRAIDAKSLQGAKDLLGGLSDKNVTVKKQALAAISKDLDRVAPKLTSGQKARLMRASAAKATSVPKAPKGQVKGAVADPKATLDDPVVRLKADKVVKRKEIQIEGDRLEIWRGSRYEKYDPTFKQRRDRTFEYAVEVDGQRVVLNRQWNVYSYKGEVVKGMPSLHPDLARMAPEDLARAMVASMTQAQQSSPNAPKWDPGLHGQVDGIQWAYGSERKGTRKEGYYGEMQIHHIGQWARTDLKTLQEEYKAGRYSPEEYRRVFDSVAYTEKYYDKKEGVEVSRLAIRVQDQADRAFVALPAGLHDTNSSLFRANHHPFINDPDTGKQRTIGIPEKGKDAESGSREWFNSRFKAGFWKQVYQREAYILRGELQRRINKGDITGQELSGILDKVYSEIGS